MNGPTLETTKRILLIEDNHSEAVLLTAYIKNRQSDIEVERVADLAGAHLASKKQTYDLILLDLNLPDGFGPNSIDELKRLGLRAPVIVITGMLADLTERISLEKGAISAYSKKQLYDGKADHIIFDDFAVDIS